MSSPIMLYAALSALLLVWLSARVIQGRVVFKVDIGDGGNEEMQRRIRVQANFIEYVPLALILMLFVQQAGFSAWIVHVLGVTLILARVLHAMGLGRVSGVSQGRFIGATATFAVLLVGSLLSLMGAFGVHF
jgi:uncharacterized membrane protein YecN with MAPEG domain